MRKLYKINFIEDFSNNNIKLYKKSFKLSSYIFYFIYEKYYDIIKDLYKINIKIVILF